MFSSSRLVRGVVCSALLAALLVLGQRWWSEVPRVSLEHSSDEWRPGPVEPLNPLHSVGQAAGLPEVVFRVTGIKVGRGSVNDPGGSIIELATSLDGLPNHNLPRSEVFRCGFGLTPVPDCTSNDARGTYYPLPGSGDLVFAHPVDPDIPGHHLNLSVLFGVDGSAPPQIEDFRVDVDLSVAGFAPFPGTGFPLNFGNCYRHDGEIVNSIGLGVCGSESQCVSPPIGEPTECTEECLLSVLHPGWEVCYTAEIECPAATVECSFDAGPGIGLIPGTATCSPAGIGTCVPDCSAGPIPCDADLGGSCGVAPGTRTCGPEGIGDCAIDAFTIECTVDLDPPCGPVAGTMTCDASGPGECVLAGDGDAESGYDTDNDCDGVFGECDAQQGEWPCPTGLTTAGCQTGTASCDESGAGFCVPPNQGVPETLDGDDNNCDGFVDECPTTQGFWSCDTGSTTPGCELGQILCSPTGTSGACHIPEVANGADDDCDGDFDECDNDEFVLACDASSQPGCAAFQGYARCENGVADPANCGCDNTCDFQDQDGDGLTDEDPGPEGCLLKFLFLPMCYVGTEAEFQDAAQSMADYLIASLGLDACSGRVAVDARFNEIPPFCPSDCRDTTEMWDITTSGGYDTEYTAIGFLTDAADPTIPVGDDGFCGELDGFSAGKVIWAQTNAPLIFAHEVGHVAGFDEEYCDKRRDGPASSGCSDGTSINPLDVALDCDPFSDSCCSADYRLMNDPTNPPAGGDVCSTTDGLGTICCRGNRGANPETGTTDSSLGRCIMSHVTAEEPRGWCEHCLAHWRGTNHGLDVPVTCENADLGAGPLVTLNLSVTPSGTASVRGGPIGVREGIQRAGLHHRGTDGVFLIQIVDDAQTVLYEARRDLEDAFRHQPLPEPLQAALFPVQFAEPRDELGLPKALRVFNGEALTWQVTLNGAPPTVVLDDHEIECGGMGIGSGVVQGLDSLDSDGDSLQATWSAPSLIDLSAEGLVALAKGVVGDHEVTLELTDGLFVSSSTANLAIVDSVAPLIFGATRLEVSTCDGEALVALEVPEVSDDCSVPVLSGHIVETNGVPVLVDVSSGIATLGPGRHVVEWRVEDAAGNSDVLVQVVDVTPAVAASRSLKLSDRASVVHASGGHALVGNLGEYPAGQTVVGVEARVGTVLSVPMVDLRDRAVVWGEVRSSGGIAVGNGVQYGELFPLGDVEFPPWADLDGLVFPPASAVVDANPGPPESVGPGSYQRITLNSGGVLQMSAGTYFVRELYTNHDATWRVAEGVTVYVKDQLTLRASPTSSSGSLVPLTLGYLGSTAVDVEKSFSGLLFAPNAAIALGAGSELLFAGRMSAKDLEFRPDVVFSCEASPGVTAGGDSVPCDTSNHIENAGFESGTQGWITWGGTLSSSSLQAKTGSKSGRAVNRTASWQGPVHDLLGRLSAGTTYEVEAWGRVAGTGQAPLALTMKVRCAGGTAIHADLDETTGNSTSWTSLNGSFTVPTCPLSELFLYVEGPPPGVSLYVDDVSLMENCQ